MIFEHTHYRSYLKATLAEAIARNASFSLRAFARQLGVAPSTLSEVLNGGKNFSSATAVKIAGKLQLSVSESEYFYQLVAFEAAREPALKASIQSRLHLLNPQRPVADLSVDAFKMISDWYHIPILELTNLTGFELTAPAAAARLGITTVEAEVAIERLRRLELLVKDRRGHLVKARDFWVINARIPNEALRAYHRQMLSKASESLETQTPQEKFVGSETFGIDPDQLKEAEGILERCLREMALLSAKAKKRSEIYHLGAQFFRLTHPETKKERNRK